MLSTFSRNNNQDRTFFITLFAITCMMNIIMAIYSVGFLHPDEHFQIIEFMNYKLGHIPASDLTWEFKEQIRPWLQVAFYFLSYRVIHFFYDANPFISATLLHIETAVLTTIAQGLFLLSFYRFKKSSFSWKITCFFILLFWLFPYLAGRTSSENFSNLFLLFALAFFFFSIPNQYTLSLNQLFQKINIPSSKLLILGCLFGLCFEARFQSAFLIFGFCLWIFLNTQQKTLFTCSVVSGFSIIIFLASFVDQWGYGVYTFPPYHYFKINLLDGAAAPFGVMSAYEYLHALIESWHYPFGLLLIFFYIISLVKYPRHLFHWIIMPLVLVHFSIAHKEVRFLFPILNIAIIPISELFSDLRHSAYVIWTRVFIQLIAAVLLIWNMTLLFKNLFNPPHQRNINALRFMSAEAPLEKKNCLYIEPSIHSVIDSDVFYLDGRTQSDLQLHFYMDNKVNRCFALENLSQIHQAAYLLIQDPNIVQPENMKHIFQRCKVVFIDTNLPNWIFKYWPQAVSYIWGKGGVAITLSC